MTSTEKTRIVELRAQGLGYKRIAALMGLPVSTVQSHCRRTNMTASTERDRDRSTPVPCVIVAASKADGEPACKHCGAPLSQPVHGKRRQFCSDTCRQKYWYQHRADASTASTHICPACGQTFVTSRPQTYCSHDCYVRARFASGIPGSASGMPRFMPAM